MRIFFILLALLGPLLLPATGHAQEQSLRKRIQEFKDTRAKRSENKEIMAQDNTKGATILPFEGRDILVYAPKEMPTSGTRSMVMVFHGGMGNAGHIRATLNMERTADKYGFVIAYLNGTKASGLNDKFKAWNGGGGCCGKPFKENVDDVGYIERAAKFLSQNYGVKSGNIYGMGHSNGGIIIQRTLCERGVFSAIIPLSGPLNIKTSHCEGASGKHVLAIHGLEDKNVPIGGGYGTKGVTDVLFLSEALAKKTFEDSGADYMLLALPNTDHSLKNIMDTIFKTQGITLGEKAARFFGLTNFKEKTP